jgi:hypothetical protein
LRWSPSRSGACSCHVHRECLYRALKSRSLSCQCGFEPAVELLVRRTVVDVPRMPFSPCRRLTSYAKTPIYLSPVRGRM